MPSSTRKGLYYSRNASDFIEAQLVSAPSGSRSASASSPGMVFPPAQAKTLLGPVTVDTVRIDKEGANKSNGIGAFLLPFFLLIAIYMTVLIYGVYVMRSVIEEKSSRVIEVLLAALPRCN